MFCPSARCPDYRETGIHAEYHEGIATCPLCGSALVEQPPEPVEAGLKGERLEKALLLSINLRPSWALVASHAAPLSALGLVCLVAYRQSSNALYLGAGVLLILLGLASGVTTARQRLVVERGLFHYTTLVGTPREARVEEIRKVYYQACDETYLERLMPFPQLRVTLGEGLSRRLVRVDMSPYRSKDERTLLLTLRELGLLRTWHS